jgi:hypothetical protein
MQMFVKYNAHNERYTIVLNTDTIICYGDTVICYGDTARLSILFSGTPPWQLVYTKDNGASLDTLKSIKDTLFYWVLTPLQTTTYQFLELRNNI